MMVGLFENFQTFITQRSDIVVLLSFIWGILSILLSPCHLSGIPLAIMGLQKQTTEPHKVIWKFSFGLFLSFFVFVAITVFFRGFTLLIAIPNDLIMFLVLFASGLLISDLFSFNYSLNPQLKLPSGLIAIGTGLIFGLMIGPCTIAFAMPIISVSGVLNRSLAPLSFIILLFFSLGHLIASVGIGASVSRVSSWLKHMGLIRNLKVFLSAVLIFVSFYYLFRFGQSF